MTGVQTCALPISQPHCPPAATSASWRRRPSPQQSKRQTKPRWLGLPSFDCARQPHHHVCGKRRAKTLCAQRFAGSHFATERRSGLVHYGCPGEVSAIAPHPTPAGPSVPRSNFHLGADAGELAFTNTPNFHKFTYRFESSMLGSIGQDGRRCRRTHSR